MSVLPKIFPRSDDQRRADTERQFIQREAELGGTLFGPVPKGRKRQFFCLDRHTWVWHEEWSENGTHHVVTTRYNVRPNGILKSQNDHSYQPISDTEATNLYQAAQLYTQRASHAYQKMLQTA